MGIAYIGLRKHQKAIDTFKKAIKIKPDYYWHKSKLPFKTDIVERLDWPVFVSITS
jgi:tetratricopeptide (TPR) repeat protein